MGQHFRSFLNSSGKKVISTVVSPNNFAARLQLFKEEQKVLSFLRSLGKWELQNFQGGCK